ncbi:MAG: glycosyltransferase family 2 protein [Desulfovibrionaceae bacterium]|nr:glycosyltransferase family 2 protein [Desulfovibrionaceae bacterium]
MRFSIIVTTRGRDKEVRAFLHSLAGQTCTDFEVILGDQNPDEELAAGLRQYAFPIIYRRLPPLSLSAARNRLLPHATGDLVALGDDDCLYHPDLLAGIDQAAHRHPRCGAFICGAHPAKARNDPPVGRYGVFQNAPSYAIFLRRDVLVAAGAFDETMCIGAPTPWQSGEETDMLLRVLEQGYPVRRCPAPFPQHPSPAYDDPKLPLKAHGYGMGRMYLLHKHNFPLHFRLCNIFYPLLQLPADALRYGLGGMYYRWAMFRGRLAGFLSLAQR